jgi:16S rRNA (guanine966-N2)-methyltransferase
MSKMRRKQPRKAKGPRSSAEAALRIIGGKLRGRCFRYNGDPGLRPMKDRVREAVFNLVGPAVKGLVVLDLFAGTGAMSFEAISRGAVSANLIERRFPNVRVIQENAESLGIAEQVVVRAGDAFAIHQQPPSDDLRWLVFCCPPYDFYQTRTAELLDLITRVCQAALPGSLIVVEADQRFDFEQLHDAAKWDVRAYPPAVIGVYDKLI